MSNPLWDHYRAKLKTAQDAVKAVRSGDWVYYSHFVMMPARLDQALSRRVGEITDVKVSTSCGMQPAQVAANDPERRSFTYHSTFFSQNDRQLHKRGLCFFTPSNFHEQPFRFRSGLYARPNVAMLMAAPMDRNGYFNLGPVNSYLGAIIDTAEKIIIEVNEAVPRCLGGYEENVHLSRVSAIVETGKNPLPTLKKPLPNDEDQKMARMIIREINDGACLQLGIGGLPNAVGSLIAKSDLKDLGVHSEMMCEAYLDLYHSGKISGRYKHSDRNKMVYTFCMGSQDLYDFLDDNPACAIFPVDYTNRAENIARNENAISINNTIQVDLYGQIVSEAMGSKHISGSGGQSDFVSGVSKSKGGKSFICLRSTRTVEGRRISSIVPHAEGIVSVPRANANFIVTEFGMVNLKGKTTWQIAEDTISVAHPDFRDDLIRSAQKAGIWRRSNQKAVS